MGLAMIPMIAGPPGGGYFGDFEHDWIPSISDMDAAISNLQARVQEFGHETFSAAIPGDADSGWLMAWNKFVGDLTDMKGELWFNRWQRRSDILAMRQRFNDLVAWWHRIPGAPAPSSSSTPTFRPEQISPPASGLESTVKWAAIGLLAIAGISALAQLSPALKSVVGKGART